MTFTNPLELYKRIRRLHKFLPPELRILGNKYLTDEFKRHRTAEKYYVGIFMREWNQYHNELLRQFLEQEQQHQQQQRALNLGKKLNSTDLDVFSDAQIGQLYQLKKAALQEKEASPTDTSNAETLKK